MSDTVKVDLEENSKYRVAYDLMKHIAHMEGVPDDKNKRREYYLNLFSQCIEVVGYRKDYADVKNLTPTSNEYAVGSQHRY